MRRTTVLGNSEIRGSVPRSAYFGGGHRAYGRYQWCIKYHGWDFLYEAELALRWAFGEHVKIGTKPNGNAVYGFEELYTLLDRPIESGTAGRSGGWLVVDTELTEGELAQVDEYVANVLRGLPDFLREEREFQAAENAAENTHHAED